MDSAAPYRAPVDDGERASSRSTGRSGEPPSVVPSRLRAVLLTLFFGSGLGHFYLRRRQRALVWSVAPNALFASSCLLLAHLSAQTGFRVFMVCTCALFSTRLFAVLDLWLLKARATRPAPHWQLFVFWVASVVYAVLVSFLVRSCVVQAFKIPSGSMLPTVQLQDHLLIDQTAFRVQRPKRGEIAVFVDPEHPEQDFIKRVLGLPGDHLEMHEGHALINGWPVPYCTIAENVEVPYQEQNGERGGARGRLDVEFLGRESYLVLLEDRPETDHGPWSVNRSEYFMIGDNRMNSADSRSWYRGRGGGVPTLNLIGRPLFVWLAFASEGSVDWPRLGQAVQGPQLPTTLHALAPALASCLRRRPAKTDPPE